MHIIISSSTDSIVFYFLKILILSFKLQFLTGESLIHHVQELYVLYL